MTNSLLSFGLSLCLFLFSLWLPAIGYTDPMSELPGAKTGLVVLEEGMLVAPVALWKTITLDEVESAGMIAWFANPVLLLAWMLILSGWRRPALIASRAAFFLSLLFFVSGDLPLDHTQTMRNTHGSFGFYVWVMSMAAAWYAASKIPPKDRADPTNVA